MKRLTAEMSLAAMQFIFPINCQGCGIKLRYNNLTYLCPSCYKSIKKAARPFCLCCGRSLHGDINQYSLCPDCLDTYPYFTQAWQCCLYEGLIKQLIHKFKYNNKIFLKGAFTGIMAEFAKQYINYTSCDAVISVPMHHKSLYKNGFDHAAVLAENLSKSLGLTYKKDYLRMIRKTQRQALLNKRQRKINVQDAFALKTNTDLNGMNLILVDDVFTTGSTANECSRILRDAGANTITVLALARGVIK